MSSSIRPGSKGKRVVLSPECLEDRTVPAGNVTAFVSGGVLHVNGDNESNQVWVMGLDRGQAIIAPMSGTTVNGSGGPIVLGGIAFAYDLRMGAGSDFLWVTNTKGSISVFADTGTGNDNLSMDYAEHSGITYLSTGSGDDTVAMGMNKLRGGTDFELGGGDDRLLLGGGEFGYVVFNGGAGTNSMGILGITFRAFPITMGFQSVYSGMMPSANNDSAAVRPGQSVTINVAANDFAPGSTLNRASIQITQQPRNGTVRVNGDGTVTYTAKSDPTGASDSFKYTIRSANGAVSNEATVAINLSGVAAPAPGAPVPTITANVNSPTDAATIQYTVKFDKDVTDFDASDIQVTNGGAVTGFASTDARTFTFSVAPSGDGDVVIRLAAGAAKSATGNIPSAAASKTIVSERFAPTVTISSNSTSPTNADPIQITVKFSEDVDDFELSDVSVTGGGAVSGFTKKSAREYTFNIAAPTSPGTIRVNIAAGVAHDAADKANTAATEFTIDSDTSALTAEITSDSTSPTKANPIKFTVVFSKDLAPNSFAQSDIVVTNGNPSNVVQENARTYTFLVTPLGDGPITIRIPENVVQATSGQGNTEVTFNIVSDRTAPTATVTSTVTGGSTATSPIPYTVTFSEVMSDFTIGDIVVQNGSVTNFHSDDNRTFTFSVVPNATGDVSVRVPANVAEDPAANGNAESNTLVIAFTGTAVTATITAGAGVTNPTNLASIPMTIQFSEAVTGFTIDDISVANGSVSDFSGSGTTYTFNVHPTADGEVTVTVAAGAGTGTSGPSAATNFTIVSDRTGPTATLTTGVTGPTNQSTIIYTVTFNEDPIGFTLDGVNVENGTASNLQPTGARTYTFEVTPTADGDVTVMVEAGAAQDALGNESPESIPSTFVSDRTNPTVAVNDSAVSMITGIATDTSDVTGVQISIFNGTNYWDGDGFDSATEVFLAATSTDDFATWSFAFTAAGTYTVHARATDAAGNVGEITNSSVTVVAPVSAAITADAGVTNPTNLASIPMTIQFGEAVTGFDASKITVINGTVTNFVAVDGDTYTFNVTHTPDTTVTVSVVAGAATATTGGAPTVAASFSIATDSVAPTATITTTAADPSSSESIPFTVTFSEDVVGFAQTDLNVTNGTVSDFVQVNAHTYTFKVIPTAGTGTGPVNVTVSLAAGAAQDAAGNNSTTATKSISADPFKPTISFTSSHPTAALAPLTVQVQFSEAVTGFAASDLVPTNGTISNFTAVDGDTYTFTLTPSAAGVVAVNIAAGTATDAIGNGNIAGQFNTTTDQTSTGMSITIPDVNASQWQAVGTEGLKIWDVQTGSGAAAPAGATVTVYYTGWLTNGTEFDSARDNGSPIAFTLIEGPGGVIAGFAQGLVGMKPGGIRRVYIPAALAYGDNPPAGSGIPAGADLVFEVKMVSWS